MEIRIFEKVIRYGAGVCLLMLFFVGMAKAEVSFGDPFEKGRLQNPNWKWQNEPPVWDLGETRDNHLFIETEPNRNLWATDATHLLYHETDIDVFDVETHFTVKWDTSSGVAGLLVKSPTDDNWVTLRFWARDANAKGQIQYQTKLNESQKDGLTGYQSGFTPTHGETDLFFRLAKDGDTYTSWYKTEATTDWIQVGITEFKLTPPLRVGIFAGNASGWGNMSVEFGYFRDNLNPFKPVEDVNADGEINILDLVLVAQAFGESDSEMDVNGDGNVNIFDLVQVANMI